MSKRRNIIRKCLLTRVQLKVQFAEILSAEGLLTAIRRIFGPQKFVAIRYVVAIIIVLMLKDDDRSILNVDG